MYRIFHLRGEYPVPLGNPGALLQHHAGLDRAGRSQELPAIVGGKEMDFTYGDCKEEMDMINKAFIETMIEGDAQGRGFQYPIPTYSITSDFDWSETENNKLLFEMTAKYGTPYFSNYINSDMKPSDVRSMCCRLRLDLRELRKKSGGFFGSGESTGSVGVVTINMPRIAYLSENEEEFYKRLNRLMDLSARSLHIKRTVITKLLNEGLYPYTKRYLGTFENHFSTIGLIGMNEACLNAKWIRQDLTHAEAQQFTKDVLNHMRERLSDYQEEYGDLYNLEATPAESTTYRLAKHDVEQFPDIITAAEKNGTPYYTNSSHLPVGYTEDVFEALDIQDELQTLIDIRIVFHTFLGEKLPDWKSAAALVRKIAENYKLPYYTMSPTYSICPNHGYLAGEQFKCPHCGAEAEVYSRITGYYRPVKNWNDGKTQEFKERKVYDITHSHMRARTKAAAEEAAKAGAVGAAQRTSAGSAAAEDGIRTFLFTTKSCPNCHIAADSLEKANIPYEMVDAEEHMDLVRKYGVMQAPTLVVVKGGQVTKLANASNIKIMQKRKAESMYDIGIIGGGTAGMTAAIYGQRAGKKTLILEGGVFGGQITSSPNVENYPGIASVSGSEFSMNLLDQATKLGAETVNEQVTGIRDEGEIKVILTDRAEYPCRSVILATGVTHRHLGVPGEEKLAGSGVSYCATCDGMFFRGERSPSWAEGALHCRTRSSCPTTAAGFISSTGETNSAARTIS